ncbi:hypothetical protein HZA26_03000 [Candidatus Nomurabacteria bacterium]|nr:hypothetical protein [Candidatus Nomurabacteria bacterium]
MIQYFPIQVPFLLDASSFFICAILSAKLVTNPTQTHSVFKPFVYLWKFPALWRLVLLRSVGFWIPAGIFNYLVFTIVKQIFQQGVMDSIWTYFAAGIGSVCATLVLRDAQLVNVRWIKNIRQKFKNLSDAHLSAIGLFGLGVTKMAFFTISSFGFGLFIFGLSSFFMTFNAMGGQALRSKLTTSQQFLYVCRDCFYCFLVFRAHLFH